MQHALGTRAYVGQRTPAPHHPVCAAVRAVRPRHRSGRCAPARAAPPGGPSSSEESAAAAVKSEPAGTSTSTSSPLEGARALLARLWSSDSSGGTEHGTQPIPEVSVELANVRKRPIFELLYRLFVEHGPLFYLVLGPKKLLIVSDPVAAKQVLVGAVDSYSKGILAEILEFVMGKGLLPSDGEHWKARRKVITPALQRKFVNNMFSLFASATQRGIDVALQPAAAFNAAGQPASTAGAAAAAGAGAAAGAAGPAAGPSGGGGSVEMEAFYSRLSLEIVGKAVFDYEFDQSSAGDPIIQAVYDVLKEAQARSTAPLPYWKLPGATLLVPRLREAQVSVDLVNATLDAMVQQTRQQLESEAPPDGSEAEPTFASVLRFLLASGEQINSKQLRDDLMTLLIAGHETTAAALTWATFLLVHNPRVEAEMRKEIDAVLGDRVPAFEDYPQLRYTTRVVLEALRLYPQPPILIRRAVQEDVLTLRDGRRFLVRPGTDLFLSLWNLHHDPALWEQAEAFVPERFGPLDSPLPSEATTDFAFLPFGGGRRKCVGDQFALGQAVVALAMLWRRYEFTLDPSKPPVDVTTGATIHTKDGLHMLVRQRDLSQLPPAEQRAPAAGGGSSSSGCPHAAAAGHAAGGDSAMGGGCPHTPAP